MAISRMNMERQMRNMGGIMGLEDQRQGYFLGKLVKKITKPIKKVVKSPLGKLALGAAAANFAPMLFGKQTLLQQAGGFGGLGSLVKGALGTGGKLETLGNLFRVGGEAGAAVSVPRVLAGLGIGSAIAAPFLMGGDEEVIDEGVDVSGIQPMVADIREQARQYYQDPTKSALYFMPPKSAVQSSFYAADGGLASIPREGYENGGGIMMASNMENDAILESLFEKYLDMGMSEIEAEKAARQEFNRMTKGIEKLNKKRTTAAEGGLMDIPREGYESGGITGILKLLSMLTPAGAAKKASQSLANMDADTLEKLSMMTPVGAAKKAGQSLANMDTDILKRISMFTPVGAGRELVRKLAMKDGGMIDMGGMEKDYREGGFVPIGAEERADDVPARLSKNEFVFTADAVRNAGGGDIDKGAEVMQNMMDNLEAGGTISEESQGMENPAQEMFNQAQMLESRIV